MKLWLKIKESSIMIYLMPFWKNESRQKWNWVILLTFLSMERKPYYHPMYISHHFNYRNHQGVLILLYYNDESIILWAWGKKGKYLYQKLRDIKWWFDKTYASNWELEIIDLVLKWDRINEPKGKHSKFQQLWVLVPNLEEDEPRNLLIEEFVGGGGETPHKWPTF